MRHRFGHEPLFDALKFTSPTAMAGATKEKKCLA